MTSLLSLSTFDVWEKSHLKSVIFLTFLSKGTHG